jgi:hypothetical protein
MKIQPRKSPQDISKVEAGLGFRKLEIQGMEAEAEVLHLFQEPNVPTVIACVLSSYEILLKDFDLDGDIEYCHFQFGYFTIMGRKDPDGISDWEPVGAPYKDAAMFLREYNAGAIQRPSLPNVIFTPVAFTHRVV